MGILRKPVSVIAAGILACWVVQEFATPWINPYHLQILNTIGIAAVMAVSLNLITGHTGQFSLGHAGFMALGAYASAAFTVHLNPDALGLVPILPDWAWRPLFFVTALAAGGATAALAGLIVGIPTLRLKGDYLAIATLGLGEIIRVIVLNLEFVGGARGFTGIPESSNFFWIFSALLVLTVLMARGVYSLKGLAFLAVREDEVAARSVGINTTRYKVLAFVLGSFWAGVGGGLFAHLNTYLHTNSFGFLKSVEYVVMVVLGGLGSITGSLVAAALLTLLPELLRIASEWRMIFYALLLVVMMILWPRGLMGQRELRWIRRVKP
ncbi:MAG TPA: branched-chain amino acid ABC transporter permease [bacterium]|nr:branched-chain amino acid ABC transporter permease [bacterium]